MVTEQRLRDAFAGLGDPLNEAQTTREMWIRGPCGRGPGGGERGGRGVVPDDHGGRGVGHPVHQGGDRHVPGPGCPRRGGADPGAGRRDRLPPGATAFPVVSMALSERMGLQAGTMRRSLVFELALLLFGGLVVGAATGLIGAAIVVPYLDPLPTIPPGRSRSFPRGRRGRRRSARDRRARRRLAGSRAARGVRLGEVLRVAD